MSSASTFRALHALGELLVLPNVWDVLSARLVEQAGARAIATSSAVVAWSRGYRDGEQLPLADVIDVAARIARSAKVPVSVDFERGYDGAEAVAKLADVGVVGVNLEDGGADPASLAATIAAVKKRHADTMFVNARSCLVLRGLMRGEQLRGPALVRELATRARLYADAGADGFFVPGLVDPADIAAVAAATRMPLNVMLRPGMVSPAELQKLGVRRLSVGAGLGEIAYAAARSAAAALLDLADTGVFEAPGLGYPEANALFSGPP